MKTYVIGDIHGRHDLLKAALAHIDELATEGTVIFLGDYVDRGPDSNATIAHLMAGPQHGSGWTWICLRGNHEDMLLECHNTTDAQNMNWWRGNGGDATMRSYGGTIPQTHIDWISELPRLHWDDHRVYVHAGVSEAYSLEDQDESVTQWYRYPKGADVGWNGKHVVHGHTPIGPEEYPNRTNLDGCAYSRGAIFVGVFDDDKAGGPISVGAVKVPK